MRLTYCDKSDITFKKTAEGYLKGRAVVTRAGVFPYMNADGTMRYELRHPDHVFKEVSLDSLKMKPVTNDHPAVGIVNADNIKELQVGYTGENVEVSGQDIIASVVVTNKDAVEAIEKMGKKQLSLGYTLNRIAEKGMYNGEAYDHIQTDIEYNHLAIVEAGRAGNAVINMDGVAVQVCSGEEKKKEPTMAQLNVRGVNYDAAQEVINAYQEKEGEVKEKQKALDALQSKHDALQAQLDEAKANLEDAKKVNSDEAIKAGVRARIELERKASKVLKDKAFDTMNDKQVMLEVIKSKHNDLSLDEKPEAYIQARFDAIVEAQDEEAVKKQAEHLNPKGDMNKDNAEIDMRERFNKLKEAN